MCVCACVSVYRGKQGNKIKKICCCRCSVLSCSTNLVWVISAFMLFHNSDASALHHKATRYGNTHTPPAPPPSQILINTHRLILSQAHIFIRVQIPFIVINQLKTEICYNNHTKNPWKQTIHKSNRITHASATKIVAMLRPDSEIK